MNRNLSIRTTLRPQSHAGKPPRHTVHLSRKTMDLNYSREHQVYKCVLGSTGIDMAFRHMVRASLGSNILKLRCIEDRRVGIVTEI